MTFSYPKNCRLLSTHDFLSLRSGASRVKGDSFVIFYKKNSYLHSRLGVSISAKNTTAVIRNRLKRVIRESFRLSVKSSVQFDFMIVLSKNISKAFVLKNLKALEKESVCLLEKMVKG